jgi:hypothetical protein
MTLKTVGISIGMLVLLGIICVAGMPMLSSDSCTPDDFLPDDRSDLTGGMKSTSAANLTYTVSTVFSSTPETVVLYRVVHPEITAGLISSIAERMGLKGAIRESSDQILLSDDHYSLEIHMKSGRVALIDVPRWMNPNAKDLPENLPSDGEAVQIATRYLEETGLLPSDAIFCEVNRPQIIEYTENGKVVGVAFEEVQVSYCRTIDGRPVIGSKLTVEIGGGGDILNVYKLWRDYAPEKEITIVTPQEAFEELKAAGMAADTEGQTVVITGIELGYYEAPAMDNPVYLVPVYIFTGEVRDGAEETTFVRYIPASPDLKEEIPVVK